MSKKIDDNDQYREKYRYFKRAVSDRTYLKWIRNRIVDGDSLQAALENVEGHPRPIRVLISKTSKIEYDKRHATDEFFIDDNTENIQSLFRKQTKISPEIRVHNLLSPDLIIEFEDGSFRMFPFLTGIDRIVAEKMAKFRSDVSKVLESGCTMRELKEISDHVGDDEIVNKAIRMKAKHA